ncbi:SUMO-activating enzyme subunit 1-like [Strongylocentrotus purpuratus]|uniref:SUMO-activating enzyme subunit 1 n=1 Tax=Strongylocentrotus purpuratus TaxID=7668 RepID=A0A7M7T5C9_STRPU|nr:SUMO-activating enzyme subunit 1-like [Strongylocentrotus purpuratus]
MAELQITEEEAELYDRQIRLWGFDAQKRLRASSLLLVGLGGLGAEVCKNIVLVGVKSITLMDSHSVTRNDASSQFLAAREDLGKKIATASVQRAQNLNPNVVVTSDEGNVCDKPQEFFKQFDIVCVTSSSVQTMMHVNQICHENDIKFFAGDIYGFYGFSFTDLNEHSFVEEKPKKVKGSSATGSESKKLKADPTETVFVKKTMIFHRLKECFDKDWSSLTEKQLKRAPYVFFILRVLFKFHDQFGRKPEAASSENDSTELQRLHNEVFTELGLKNDLIDTNYTEYCAGELGPTCAIVGGIIGQEIIKAASGRDAPLDNFFLYDGVDSLGMVDCIIRS